MLQLMEANQVFDPNLELRLAPVATSPGRAGSSEPGPDESGGRLTPAAPWADPPRGTVE
jgi:hypothetical protein